MDFDMDFLFSKLNIGRHVDFSRITSYVDLSYTVYI